MNDCKNVDWDISPEDVGRDEYDSYRVTSINYHFDSKEIWSINYSFIWNCGDGCCSDKENGIAYLGDISEWLKERILDEMPGYKFEG